MRVLVTGADGFVGRWTVRRLRDLEHEVIEAVGPAPSEAQPKPSAGGERLTLDLTDPASVTRVAGRATDAVVHLAAVASGFESQRDPLQAWMVNAVGTALLAEALGKLRAAGAADPVLLCVSTAEVYGMGTGAPRREVDPVAPCSPYAATKAAAEVAALEVRRRTGLRTIVARPFPHTGPGQDTRFVAPAFVERLRIAARRGAPVVKVGRLEPVRELLDVRDVVDAYLTLLDRGVPGESYNVCGGEALSVGELFRRLADVLETRVLPEPDPDLTRPQDIPHLVGCADKIRNATGWRPRRTLDETLRDLVHAQAN